MKYIDFLEIPLSVLETMFKMQTEYNYQEQKISSTMALLARKYTEIQKAKFCKTKLVRSKI